MPMYQNIIVATDLHNDCVPIVKRATEVAEQNKAKLTVVNVVPNVPYYMAAGLSSISDIESQLTNESKERLHAVKDKIDYEAGYVLLHGSAKQEIVRYSREANVDLIVIGSHGHRGVQRLLGSTAANVCHRAPCDVLLVRVKD
jgi:universal stress protein A